MRICVAALALVTIGLGQAAAQSRDVPARQPPCAVAAAPDETARLTPEGDVTWAGGRRGRVMGLAAGPGGQEVLADALRSWAAAGPFAVAVIDPEPDRWDRVPVHAVRGRRTIAEDLVAGGQAAVRPEGLPPRCLQALLALEHQAREARLGRWSGPPLAAEDRDALLAAEGRFAVVEGRIRSLGRTPGALYLNFGGLGANDFAVTIPKRSLRRFEAWGMTDPQWQGRRVRVRGVVLGRDRPRMEVTMPEALERLD